MCLAATRCLGPFSSSLLPLLEAVDTFGRVMVMAVIVPVVVVDGHGCCGRRPSSFQFFVASSLVINNDLKKVISKEKKMKKEENIPRARDADMSQALIVHCA
jgi:hypothetical protein